MLLEAPLTWKLSSEFKDMLIVLLMVQLSTYFIWNETFSLKKTKHGDLLKKTWNSWLTL